MVEQVNEINEAAYQQNVRSRMFFTSEMGKSLFLFLFGGMLYFFIEVVYRGFSHYSMIICGGLAFLMIGRLNEGKYRDMPILSQMVIGGIIITVLEFVTGFIVNIVFHENVWDYSLVPYNILGQVCLAYSNLWFLVSPLCIFLDDFIRWFIFGEEKHHYRLV